MEYWDIYDADHRRTGRTMQRNDWNMKPGDYHLTVLGVVCRPDGRFLITQRVMTKSWAPGWWEVSGGGVMAGEESLEAVLREVREETGLDCSSVTDGAYQFTYRRDNSEAKDNYLVDVYRFCMEFEEQDVKVQENEVLGWKLATLEEIRALAAEGIFLHYDSIRQVFDL